MDPVARWLVALVPLRLLLDGLWWVQTPLGSAGQVGSGLMFVGLVAVVARRWRDLPRHPLAMALLPLTVVVIVGMIRGTSPQLAVALGIHLLIPVVWVLALWLHPPAVDPLPIWVAFGAVPVGIGLVCALAGQPAEHVLHGWPRLLGAYGNVHTHAGVMAVIAVSAAAVSVRGHRAFAVLAVAAAICLVLTFVRTAWMWAAIAAVAGLWVGGHRWVAAIGGAVGVAAGLASGRLGDLIAVATWTPPPGGWGALGSSRVRIWSDVIARFVDGGPAVWIAGRGLGGHLGLHRHFDPHSEVLSVLVQLGALGLLCWGATIAVALVQARRRGAAVAFGLLCGAVATAPLSNDWITRATVSLWVWGCLGWGLRPVPADPPAPGATAPP